MMKDIRENWNIIKESELPIYILGATSKTSKALYTILEKEHRLPKAVWDKNWQLIRGHIGKYSEISEILEAIGLEAEPVPIDLNTMNIGIVLVASEERYQKDWLRYAHDNGAKHSIMDAYDLIFAEVYESCMAQNISTIELLERCRDCRASFRSCPVRRDLYQKSGKKKDKVIRHLAFKVGYICNLRCEYCCEFLPKFDHTKRKKVNIEACIEDVKKLSNSMEYINCLSFSGGDAMLNKELAILIRETVKYENIGDIYILTNGTYVPCKDILDALEENRKRIRININNYSINEEAKSLCKELRGRGITHTLRDNDGWYDLNDLAFRGRSVNELYDLYENCSFDANDNYYYILFNGKLNMRCGVANGIMYYKNLYDDCKQDYIDIRKLSEDEIPHMLEQLENRKYLDVCNYCRGCRVEQRTLGAAENQL